MASTRSARVMGVGACMMDMIAYAPRLPLVGETVHGTAFEVGFGGKGANQVVQAAKLGAATAMVARVGGAADPYGAATIQNFNAAGVGTEFVLATDGATTGVAPIAVDDAGNNTIVIVPGANTHLSPSDVQAAVPAIVKRLEPSVMLCQLEVPMETTVEALRLARQHGVATVFNPAPAVEALPPELLPLCDWVCPNETEAALLTGVDTSSLDGCRAAASALMDQGCDNVVVTMGSAGALVCTRKAGAEATHVEAPAIGSAAVDTAGAGDSFLGSFAYALAAGASPEAATQLGVEVASRSVQGRGTQASYWSGKQLQDAGVDVL